jgi:hypothetical protein
MGCAIEHGMCMGERISGGAAFHTSIFVTNTDDKNLLEVLPRFCKLGKLNIECISIDSWRILFLSHFYLRDNLTRW